MTPKENMIETLRDWMLGDYGHDLPAGHFEQEVERLLSGLDEAGFVIMAGNTRESVIEECAKVAEFKFAGSNLNNIGGLVAADIRALSALSRPERGAL